MRKKILFPLIFVFSLLIVTAFGLSPTPTTQPAQTYPEIGIGLGLNKETTTLLDNQEIKSVFPLSQDFVDIILRKGDKTNAINQSQKLGVKVMCVNLSLVDAKATLSDLKSGKGRCDYLGYNPEKPKKTQQTPSDELDNFVESVKAFSALAKEYGVKNVIGPGYAFMSTHEDLYSSSAKSADIWLIQTQALTLDKKTNTKATPEEYRQKVQRVISLIHKGNPDTRIWIQIVISQGPGNQVFTTEEVISYIKSITGIVDAVRIYTGNDPSQTDNIVKIIKTLRP